MIVQYSYGRYLVPVIITEPLCNVYIAISILGATPLGIRAIINEIKTVCAKKYNNNNIKLSSTKGVLPWQSCFTIVTFKHLIFTLNCNYWSKFAPVRLHLHIIIPKILQSFISSHLAMWFCHPSQKTSMPPNQNTFEFQNQSDFFCWVLTRNFSRHLKKYL